MAMGRLTTWASAASDLLLGERTERPAVATRPPSDLAERISQAGRQVLEADAESQTTVPRSARLRVREVQTPRTLPALPAGLKTRTRRVEAWNFDGGVSTTAESSGKEMSLVSILQRQHQALPEWGGTPEVKSPRQRRNRNETSGPLRLSGGRAVPKMNVRQFLELLKNPGRIDTDLQPRQKYVFIEDLVPARSHVSLVRSIGSDDRKEVVVKTLRKGCFLSSEEEEQWFRSNSELRMLEPHENLCQILDLWKDWKDNSYHLVMELVPGMDLFTLLQQQGPLGPQIASQITKDVLQGLAVLHGRKLVHRDIKLQNIMAQPCHNGMKVKIIDFDTVWPVEGSDPSFVVGSDQYIAPEAYEAGYSPASDLFAVGVVCFALCFGRFPFSCKIFDDQPGENFVASPKMLEIARRLRSAQISWPEKHQETKDFCRWLLDMSPERRPSDASKALTHPFLRG